MRTATLSLLLVLAACKPNTVAEGRDGVDVVFTDAADTEVAIVTLPYRRSVRRRLLGNRGRQSGAVRYDDGGALVLATTGFLTTVPLAPTFDCDPAPHALRLSFEPEDGVRLALGEGLLEAVEGGTVLGAWTWEGDVQSGAASLVDPVLDGCTTEGRIDVTWSFDPDRIATVPRPGTPPVPSQP